jgi:hypothetical protein
MVVILFDKEKKHLKHKVKNLAHNKVLFFIEAKKLMGEGVPHLH